MKIEPGVLCYLRYENPEYVDHQYRHLNGCAVVEVVEFAGRSMCKRDHEPHDYWEVRCDSDGSVMDVVDFVLQPIPPDELKQLTETQKPKEEAPA